MKKFVVGLVLTVLVFTAFGIVISRTESTISKLEKEKQALLNELSFIRLELVDITTKVMNTDSELRRAKTELSSVLEELEKLRLAKRYSLRDPTYHEAMEFIYYDETDLKPYDEETFTCMHYAMEVNNNAERKGIRCAYVIVKLRDGSHALVAFQIPDKGLLFIEPQTDEKVNLEVGKDYWADCVVVEPGYYYERNPGNTVENFVLYW